MPVSYSFRPAWDARKKTDEVSKLPSPRSVSPPKLPNSPFSLSYFSFPAPSINLNTASSVQQPLAYKPSLSQLSFPTPPTNPTSASPVSPLHALDSFSLPLNTLDIESAPRFPQLEPQSVPSRLDHSSSMPTNLYHSRFASTLQSSPTPPTMPTPSSRAPQLDFPSHLRPPVSAANRLLAWTTPYAQKQRSALESSLPPALVNKAYHVVYSALAPATRSTYGAGLLRFTQFCDSWKINEQDRMPASAALIAAFVAQCIGAYSGKTVNSWLAGLRSWHIMNRAPWHGDDNWVHLARTTANKQGTAFKRPLRAPVSLEHLRVLRRNLDITSSFHAAVWATALVTLFGCRRLGETTVKALANFNPALHVTHDAPVSFRQLPNGSTSASIHIPWTKTTKHEGATIIITSRNDDLCPVTALRNHLAINNNAPSSMSFFAYKDADGSFVHMLRARFLDIITGTQQQTPN